MCLYVCVCLCVYVCMCVCVCMYVYMYIGLVLKDVFSSFRLDSLLIECVLLLACDEQAGIPEAIECVLFL